MQNTTSSPTHRLFQPRFDHPHGQNVRRTPRPTCWPSRNRSLSTKSRSDLSTSLPVYMRFGKAPVLEVTPQDVDESASAVPADQTMLRSDKEHTATRSSARSSTTAFYIIEINQREQPGEIKQGRCEYCSTNSCRFCSTTKGTQRGALCQAAQYHAQYLSSVKEVSGKTAARWIDESVILSQSPLLKYSGMSIQEIAYHLNFLDAVLLRQVFQTAHKNLALALQTKG